MDIRYIESDIGEVVSRLNETSIFSLDIEATGLNPLDSRILLCQIGIEDIVYVVNASKVDLSFLIPYLKSYKWRKIIQNAKFEQKYFKYYFDTPINNVFDTMLAERLLFPDNKSGTSLEALALKYLKKILNKDIRKSFFDTKSMEFSTEQISYAAEDANVLMPIMQAQFQQISNNSLVKVAELEFDLTNIVASMELAGVPIDLPKWKSKIAFYENLHEQSRLRMNSYLFDNSNLDEQMGMFTREGINLNSAKQVKEAFHKIGLNVDATNEREIALVNHPAAKELLTYRGLQKIISSYGATFLEKIHPFTGRIHADWIQLGTETGRFSCKDPNLQQMPDEFRQCVSQEDFAIVGADYSQMELRILAELSGDKTFLKAFTSGEDLHSSTAATMFNIPIDKVTKEQRFIAKTINFGISYGMGVKKLRDMLNAEAYRNKTRELSYPEVQAILSRYHRTYYKVKKWLEDVGDRSYADGYSTTMYGRKRFYEKPVQDEDSDYTRFENQVAAIKRKGANTPIQGTNADITKLAMVNLKNNLDEGNFRANIILQVHDEIVVLAHKRQAEAVKEVVIKTMTESAQQVLKKVPVKVDAYISDIWKK